jgi:uncharacterized protein (DUF58 family)
MTTTKIPPESEVVELRHRPAIRSRLVGRESILWLLASGLMLFIGILKGINLVIVLGYVLIGLWFINWLLARRALRGVSVKRLPRPTLLAGVPTEWALEVYDRGSATNNWVLEERAGDAVASWLIVRAGSTKVFRPRVRALFPRRGKFRLEPLIARSSFPFGLAVKSTHLLPAEEIIVFPKPARVDSERLRAWLFRPSHGHDEERRRVRRVVEREAEIHGLRDYRHGDPPRRIHWKATARRNRLTVREYEDTSPPRLLVIVDPWLPKRPTRDDRDRLEAVISLAAGVCQEWRRGAGARLALAIAGPKPIAIDGAPTAAIAEQQLIALALEEGGEAGDVATMLGSLTRLALSAPAILLSGRADSPVRAVAQRTLGRTIAAVDVGRPEHWYRFE